VALEATISFTEMVQESAWLLMYSQMWFNTLGLELCQRDTIKTLE